MSDEFDTEPVPGLPELLPEGESMLWQGSPDWMSAARRIMHADLTAGYFAMLLAWPFASAALDGGSITAAAAGSARTAVIAVIAIGLLCLVAWLIGRTTLYTITNRRVVMRYGIALPITINVPFKAIETAAFKPHGDGTGDVALAVTGPVKLAYLNLWPHVRAWRISNAEPTLRSIANAGQVATLLAQAMSGATVRPMAVASQAASQDHNPISHIPAAA